MNFLHIGAGAGDLDPKTNFRDGFSELVKSFKNKNKNKIFVVEANPINIKKLKKCWTNYKFVKIYNFAITEKKNLKKVKFFFSLDDGPHYQLFSNNINHVKHYFPNSKIRNKIIKSININLFLTKYVKEKMIDYFSLDVEGMDYQIMMKLDLKKNKFKYISFEYLHLSTDEKKRIIKKLQYYGYSYGGFGVDHNNLDWLFIKKKSKWNNLISNLLPIFHRKHYKRLNKLLIK